MEKKLTEREIQFMRDRKGVPLNPAIAGNNPKKYGAFQQH